MEVRKFILDNSLSLCGIVETKVRSQNITSTMKNCLPANWDYIHNSGARTVARAIFTWNTSLIKADLISSSAQHITCRINHVNTLQFFNVTLVYGMNQPTDRGMLWSELRGLHRALGVEPWILLGDFNAVRRVNERSIIDNFDFIATAYSCI